MRVLQLCTSTLDSHYFANLGKGLAKVGVDVVGASLRDRTRPVWVDDAQPYFCIAADSWPSYPFALARLVSLLRRVRPDLIQTHLFDAGLIGVLAGRLAGVAVVLTRHHTDAIPLTGTRMHLFLDRWATGAATRVVVLAESVRRHMREREGLAIEKVDVVPQGFDFARLRGSPDDRERVRRELKLENSFVLGTLARFSPEKGHRYLFEAAKLLRAKIPGLKLLLAGGGSPRVVLNAAEDLGVRDIVILPGYRSDVPAVLRALDVLVHPSLTEAFCQVLIEALTAGTPVVATNVASASEVIRDGESGFLVPARDPSAIASRVMQLYADRALGQRMAAAGGVGLDERFSIEAMVRRQVEVYEKALAQNGQRLGRVSTEV